MSAHDYLGSQFDPATYEHYVHSAAGFGKGTPEEGIYQNTVSEANRAAHFAVHDEMNGVSSSDYSHGTPRKLTGFYASKRGSLN